MKSYADLDEGSQGEDRGKSEGRNNSQKSIMFLDELCRSN
jgi:hypothetical protein